MRQADRVGDESRSVWAHETARVLSEKNRARSTSSAPVFEAEHLLLGWVRSTGRRRGIGVLRWNLSSTVQRSVFFSPPAFTIRSNQSCVTSAQTWSAVPLLVAEE